MGDDLYTTLPNMSHLIKEHIFRLLLSSVKFCPKWMKVRDVRCCEQNINPSMRCGKYVSTCFWCVRCFTSAVCQRFDDFEIDDHVYSITL